MSTVTRQRSTPSGGGRRGPADGRPSGGQAGRPGGRPGGWESRLLAALVYPTNLAAAGIAAFLLSLLVVTALPAAIAAARALNAWQVDGETAVFTRTFREFARTWKRSWLGGVLAALAGALLVVDAAFLTDQLAQGSSIAIVLLAATVPVAIALALLLLAIPVAASRLPDAGLRDWLVGAGALVAWRPFRSVFLLAIVVALALTCYLLPAFAPFFGASLPVYLALVTWRLPVPRSQ